MKTKTKILYPNCSEMVWRLNKEKVETGTDSFPNSCLGNMIGLLKDAKDNNSLNRVRLTLVENNGGGGNEYYVRGCFQIAHAFIKGNITKEEANEIDEKFWNNNNLDLDKALEGDELETLVREKMEKIEGEKEKEK